MSDVCPNVLVEDSSTRPAVRTWLQVRVADRHLLQTAFLILLLPNLLFAAQLRWAPALAMVAGAGGYVWLVLRDRVTNASTLLAQSIDIRRLTLCMGTACIFLVLGGEGHFAFANWDWLWRDAVLADVARAPFPPLYNVGGDSFFLRAPLGMYMLPAFVAKAFSLGAAHVVLLAQNATMLGIILYFLAALAGRTAVLAVAVFLSFSGLDVIGQILFWVIDGHSLASFVLPSHIEGWKGLQYSSVVTLIFWVPNHALPSFWLALLALLCAKEEIGVGQVLLAMAASLFWSPFAFIGMIPFALFLGVRALPTTLRSGQVWLSILIAVSFLPVALYMQADAARVPHGLRALTDAFVLLLAIFLAIEIPHAAIVLMGRRHVESWTRGLAYVAIGFLTVLPFVHLGRSNDLVMRGSIPALTILAIAFAQVLAKGMSRPWLTLPAVLIVLVGGVTPMQEIIRSQALPAYAFSACNLVTVWKKLDPADPSLDNYLARASRLPSWIPTPSSDKALTDQPARLCWPDFAYVGFNDVAHKSTSALMHLGASPR